MKRKYYFQTALLIDLDLCHRPLQMRISQEDFTASGKRVCLGPGTVTLPLYTYTSYIIGAWCITLAIISEFCHLSVNNIHDDELRGTVLGTT